MCAQEAVGHMPETPQSPFWGFLGLLPLLSGYETCPILSVVSPFLMGLSVLGQGRLSLCGLRCSFLNTLPVISSNLRECTRTHACTMGLQNADCWKGEAQVAVKAPLN